jgi:hypothetical protein
MAPVRERNFGQLGAAGRLAYHRVAEIEAFESALDASLRVHGPMLIEVHMTAIGPFPSPPAEEPEVCRVHVAQAAAGLARHAGRAIARSGRTRERGAEVLVRSGCADFHVRIEGKPSPANPKTSLPTAFSIARLVLNRVAAQVI